MSSTNNRADQHDNNSVNESRLIHFHISFFATVMGLSGLTLAWKAAGQSILPGAYLVLGGFSSLVMLIITAIYLLKAIRYPDAVLSEARHPIRLNFFPAFSISLLLLSVVWEHFTPVSQGLWVTGSVIQLCLTIYVMSSWIHHTHYTLAHANPSWFIPVVGNIIVPITGSHLGYTEISWFFFSIGIVFWIILLTIVMYRLFFHEPLPARLTPMLFILLAPPSVGLVSYTSLVGEIDIFARVLYYIALFLGILLFSNIIRFMKVPFFISSWAYSFPVASLTIATTKMSGFIPGTFFSVLKYLLLALVSVLLFWLIIRTANAIVKKQICLPE
ncbi:C4-dicarboxylate ABC transporter [Vibrio sp. HA2012]|uniref:SLAC1 anion channel family protein n=1 Tax=Vibrio sp. HA2012 TaxID=1971595 RepID=UPI000C2C1424|nr:SLAC1 anion channel family protein [Vibrio sp. HA2012]PJC88140.1 C4-dicarboxylate ABC transporter [Vibrio sp. HA2012]